MAEQKPEKLGPGGWFLIGAMVVMLVAAVIYAVQVWTSMDATMSAWGWTFLILGILISFGLGAGLMALVFYSNRHNYDR